MNDPMGQRAVEALEQIAAALESIDLKLEGIGLNIADLVLEEDEDE